MSIDFKNKTTQGIGTGFTEVYTCPGSAKSAVVFGMTIANVESSAIPIATACPCPISYPESTSIL